MVFPPTTEVVYKRAKIVEIGVICWANLANSEEATGTTAFSHYNEFLEIILIIHCMSAVGATLFV